MTVLLEYSCQLEYAISNCVCFQLYEVTSFPSLIQIIKSPLHMHITLITKVYYKDLQPLQQQHTIHMHS